MEKDRIVYPYVRDYMRAVRKERTGPLGELERWARGEKLPVSDPETADLLEILCRLRKPKRILEIGTCVGFSALLMAQASPGAQVDTIERSPHMVPLAKKNFAAFSQDTITLWEGDAAKIIPGFSQPYDLIYLDAAKGQYPHFFTLCRDLLPVGGLWISDNVLFNGYVAQGKADVRRNKTIVSRLDTYLKMLERDPDFQTVLLPASDGVTVSLRVEGGDADCPQQI